VTVAEVVDLQAVAIQGLALAEVEATSRVPVATT
jgi:hypothetical protein